MKRVLTAAVLIPIVLALVFLAPNFLVILALGIVALLASNELFRLGEAAGIVTFRRTVLASIAGVFLYAALIFSGIDVPEDEYLVLFPIFLFLLPFALLAIGLRKQELREVLPGAALSYFTFGYIVFPLASVFMLRGLGPALLAIVLIVTWVGDVAAMYAGRAFGKHKLAPRISPGKTVEGSIASLTVAIVVCWLLFKYVLPWSVVVPTYKAHSTFAAVELVSVWGPLLLGFAINVAAQLGDLVESAIKRGAGAKDSGTLLPGHGGVLDRIDALLFSAPVGMLILLFTRDSFLR